MTTSECAGWVGPNVVYICPVSSTVTGYEFHCGCHRAYVRIYNLCECHCEYVPLCVLHFLLQHCWGWAWYSYCVLLVKVLLLLYCVLY